MNIRTYICTLENWSHFENFQINLQNWIKLARLGQRQRYVHLLWQHPDLVFLFFHKLTWGSISACSHDDACLAACGSLTFGTNDTLTSVWKTSSSDVRKKDSHTVSKIQMVLLKLVKNNILMLFTPSNWLWFLAFL